MRYVQTQKILEIVRLSCEEIKCNQITKKK